MLFWQEWFLDRCQGRATPIPETASGGWPGAGAAEWEPLRSRFLANLERAAAIYEAGGDEVIAPAIEIPFMASYTIRDAMTHMAMHNAHHLGQIITLRQIGGSWPPPKGGMTW
jgi:uncharacterized damage-inducible protein DinB